MRTNKRKEVLVSMIETNVHRWSFSDELNARWSRGKSLFISPSFTIRERENSSLGYLHQSLHTILYWPRTRNRCRQSRSGYRNESYLSTTGNAFALEFSSLSSTFRSLSNTSKLRNIIKGIFLVNIARQYFFRRRARKYDDRPPTIIDDTQEL